MLPTARRGRLAELIIKSLFQESWPEILISCKVVVTRCRTGCPTYMYREVLLRDGYKRQFEIRIRPMDLSLVRF